MFYYFLEIQKETGIEQTLVCWAKDVKPKQLSEKQ